VLKGNEDGLSTTCWLTLCLNPAFPDNSQNGNNKSSKGFWLIKRRQDSHKESVLIKVPSKSTQRGREVLPSVAESKFVINASIFIIRHSF